MVITCVHVHVRPEGVNSFIKATVVNCIGTAKEKGNIRFDFMQQSDDPCRFMIFEVFDSPESVAAHKETAHYLKWREEVENLMAEKRFGIKYNIIEPKEINKC